MKCFHHNDLDGRCAAYWVYHYNPDMKKEDFIEIDYDMNIDWFSKIDKGEKVIIVDFSFSPEDMKRIIKKTENNVVWIDHHKSAIEKFKDFEHKIAGIRYDGIAGCMLTYCFFAEMRYGLKEFNPDMAIKAPWFTKYLHDYDVWKFDYSDETTYFQLAMRSEDDTSPTASIWKELFNIEKVRECIEKGSIIVKYRDSVAKKALDWAGFEADIEGHKALVLNTPIGGSEQFGDRIKDYELVCSYCYIGDGKYSYSLYSNGPKKIDTSEISKKFGGGGHAGASGFTINKNLFK